jgi:hypothetical protein
MPLIRGHHNFDDHFTQIPNAWVRDNRLSFKAIGLLAQIMSHRPGWNMSIRSLARLNGTGTGTVKSAIEELEKLGYLVRSKEQLHNEDGTFADFEWTTADPFQNPATVKPVHAFQATKNTNTKEEQDIKNNERIYSDFQEFHFEEFWSYYPKKVDKGAAIRAFRKAAKTQDLKEIIEGAKRYAEDPNLPEKQFIKNPATWLNAESWNNGPLPKRKTTDSKALEEWAND